MHNLTNAFVIYDINRSDTDLLGMHIQIYKYDLSKYFKVALIVMCVFNSCALVFLIKLIIFHIELRFKGLTTYEYLKLQENTTRESKFVTRVNQEKRDEMKQEGYDREKIKKEQAVLVKKLV
jgi:hypothetical protein